MRKRNPIETGPDCRAMPINPLIVVTPEEQAIFQRAEGLSNSIISADVEYNRTKKLTAKNSLSQRPPTSEEAELIHNMYLEQREYSIFHFIPCQLSSPTLK